MDDERDDSDADDDGNPTRLGNAPGSRQGGRDGGQSGGGQQTSNQRRSGSSSNQGSRDGGSGSSSGSSSRTSNAQRIDREFPGHHEYDVPDRPVRNRNDGYDPYRVDWPPVRVVNHNYGSRESGQGQEGAQRGEQPGEGRGWGDRQYRFAHEHMPMSEMGGAGWPPYPWTLQAEGGPQHYPQYQAGRGFYGMHAMPPWSAPYYENQWRQPPTSDNPGHGSSGQGSKSQGQEKQNMDSDKVSVNLGAGGFGPLGGYGGGNGGGGDGSTNAALLALLAMGQNRGNDHCGDGFGLGGGLGAIIALSALGGGGGLFNRGGHGDHVNVDCGGRRGGNHDHDGILFNQITQTLGAIQGAIPAAGLEIQNSILTQTNALQGQLSTNALATQIGFANTGDKVTNVGTALLAAIGNDGTATRTAIAALSDKVGSIDRDNLQRQLTVAQNALIEDRFDRRSRDVEVNVSQNVVQAQAQQQQQQQFGDLLRKVDVLCGQLQFQSVRQGQDVINFGGTMTGSGTQSSLANQVR